MQVDKIVPEKSIFELRRRYKYTVKINKKVVEENIQLNGRLFAVFSEMLSNFD